jgi:hypothetical protein
MASNDDLSQVTSVTDKKQSEEQSTSKSELETLSATDLDPNEDQVAPTVKLAALPPVSQQQDDERPVPPLEPEARDADQPAIVSEPELPTAADPDPDDDQTMPVSQMEMLPAPEDEQGEEQPTPSSESITDGIEDEQNGDHPLSASEWEALSAIDPDEDQGAPTVKIAALPLTRHHLNGEHSISTQRLQTRPAAPAKEKEAETIHITVPSEKKAFPLPFTPWPRILRPPTHRRRIFSILLMLLVALLIFASVRLSGTLSALNEQLFVRVGGQRMAVVDLRQSLPISPYLLGTNVFPQAGTSSLDQEDSGFMSYSHPIVGGLQNARVKLMRFPGGGWGEDHLLSYDQLNAFSIFLSQVNAEGMVQARLSGTTGHGGEYVASLLNRATLAGNWVDYMNNPRSSFRTGKYANAPFHPIRFWTVGSEPDRLINPDTGKPFTVAEYINAFILFSTIMHQNSPTIQVFGPELSQFYAVGAGPRDANGQLWMETFLKGIGAYEKAHPELTFRLLDGLSFHFYPFNDAAKAPAALLSSADEWHYLLPPLRQLVRQHLGRDIPIAVTEINAAPAKQVPSPGISTLWWADTLGALMDQEVEYVAFSATEGVNTPYPLFTSDGLRPTSMYRVLELFSHLQRNRIPVAAQGNPISLYATRDDAQQTVSLLFINKSATTQFAQVSAQDPFLGNSAWGNLDISLFAHSIQVITLHRGGGAEAYSYRIPTLNDAGIAPLVHTVCGRQTDPLANEAPC